MKNTQLKIIFVSILIFVMASLTGCNGKNESTVEKAGDSSETAVSEVKSERSGAELAEEAEKVSYIYGYQVGQNVKMMKDLDFELNLEAFTRGIEDMVNDNPLELDENEMAQVMQKFQTDMNTKQQAKMEKDKVINLSAAETFIAQNKKKKGVETLSAGIQYEVLNEGSGPTPKATDKVKVHYRGTLIDGTEFDSSYTRNEPFEFTVNTGVIRGWTEAVQHMKVGSKW
ncbi:MAG: FKBP-type peptidyl-prolyl cis-trans isomerase, partial [Candidatus Latescibacteria bacterium]|nr:FKBP-type peptidyl-prolyl cis-trans isomerase [Candidatus Latescibacterota bacterium]